MFVVKANLEQLYQKYLKQLKRSHHKLATLNLWSDRLSSIYQADNSPVIHQFIGNWLKVIKETKASIK